MARIWRGWVQRVTCSYQYLPRAEAAERLRQGLGSYGSARRPRHTLLDQLEQVYRAVRAIIGVVKLEMAPMMLAPGRCARAAGLKLRQPRTGRFSPQMKIPSRVPSLPSLQFVRLGSGPEVVPA